MKPRQDNKESTSENKNTQHETHYKLPVPLEPEKDVSNKPATTSQSETTPARRNREDVQLDEELPKTRPNSRGHLPLKYQDFVM